MNGMNAVKTLMLTSALILALLVGPATQAVDAQSLTYLGRNNVSNNFNPQFREASGLGLAKNESKLWSVSDDNFTMYKMELNGAAVESFQPTPAAGAVAIGTLDLEGVSFGPPPPGITDDHYIYLVNEAANAIVPVNYNTRQYRSQVPLSAMSGYSTVNCLGGTKTVQQELTGSDANSGLEGITWNSALNNFFVVKEKGQGLMIQISANLGTILACKRLNFGAGVDYSGISYDTQRSQYWIVSDEGQAVYLYDWNTATAVKYPLGFGGGEGVSFNPANNRLYIVTDNGGGADSYMYTYSVQ